MIFFFLFLSFFSVVKSATLLEKIRKKEEDLKIFSTSVVKFYNDRCSKLSSWICSYDACQSTLFNSTCNHDATISSCQCKGMLMSLQKSVIRLPSSLASGSYKNPSDEGVKDSIMYTARFDKFYEILEHTDHTTEWQGFGTWDGVFRIYPGRAQSTCGEYDPRVRSWYTAAASGGKDVIIVIDRSSSMLTANRWALAKSAAKSVLNTLTWMDYVNIVMFDGEEHDADTGALYLVGNTMLPANAANKLKLTNAIDSTSIGSYANFGIGIKYAFDILIRSRNLNLTSLCESTAILFLSHGFISTTGSIGYSNKQDLYDYINTENQKLAKETSKGKAVLFSYSLSYDSYNATLKEMACETEGLYQHIPDGGDLVRSMSGFYSYFSTGMADRKNRTVWVEPYKFATDGTLGTSVSMPVYSYDSDPPVLLGVAALGVSVASLSTEYEALLDLLVKESASCPKFNLTKCQMEALRARSDSANVCHGSECTGTINLNPKPCEGSGLYPSNLWCNHEGENYLDRACCCASDPIGQSSQKTYSWIFVAIFLYCLYFAIDF